jgi:hypothetical protein
MSESNEKEMADALEVLTNGSEEDLRDLKLPWPETEEELLSIIRAVTKRRQDYGTCVYAMSLSAVAAFYYASSLLGVSGFQASCADLDIIRRTRHIELFRILHTEDLLYPQYCDDEHFPTWQMMLEKNKDWFSKKAKERLADGGAMHPNVKAHLEKLASR